MGIINSTHAIETSYDEYRYIQHYKTNIYNDKLSAHIYNDIDNNNNNNNSKKIEKYLNKLRVLNNKKYYHNHPMIYSSDDLKNLKTIEDIINWIKTELIGVRYKWVYFFGDSYINKDAFHAINGPITNYQNIYMSGMNCIGLINLIYRKMYSSISYIYHNYDDYQELGLSTSRRKVDISRVFLL